MSGYIKNAAKVQAEINKAYAQSAEYIQAEIKKTLGGFQKATGLTEAQAKILLKTTPTEKNIIKIRKVIDKIENPQIKAEMLGTLNNPAYRFRVERLERLQQRIVTECNRLYGTELKLTNGMLANTAKNAYLHTMFDIQSGLGLGFSFSQFSTSRINAILQNVWSGKHFSKRIWSSTDALAQDIRQDLLSGFMTGKSGRKIAAGIAERYSTSFYNADRLVRTEMNFVANQAELESYKECGIEKYEYLATLDDRTSAICQELDGQVFAVSDAQAGTNLPPMHPHCRSTTVAVIDEATTEGLERRARNSDGTTSKVPADMHYKEWKAKYADDSS